MPFSIESLWEEVDIEINNKKRSKILADLSSLNLNRLDHVSLDVVLCAVALSRWVLPLVVQHQVLKIRCPAVDEGDLVCLLQCVLKLPNFPLADNNNAFHVFTPLCDVAIYNFWATTIQSEWPTTILMELVRVWKYPWHVTDAAFIMDTQSMETPVLDGTYMMQSESQLKPLCFVCVQDGTFMMNPLWHILHISYHYKDDFCHLLFWSLSLVGVIQWFFWGLQQSSRLENRLVSHFFQKIWLQLRFYF